MKCYIIYHHLYDYNGEYKIVGGIESYLLSLGQVMKYYNLSPVIVHRSISDFTKDENGIEIRGYSMPEKKCYKKLYQKIEKELSDEDILIWGLDRNAVKVKHERTISIQHGIPFDYYPEEKKVRKRMLELGLGTAFKTIQRYMARKCFERSKYKVCVDYNFWNWYRTFCLPIDEKNIFVIPNFTEIGDPRVKSRESGKIRIVFARRFVRMRGIEVFIDVMKHYGDNNNISFTCAGEGPYLKKIEELASKQGNIEITKYEPAESLDFHTQFDIAVVPTIASEGTSLSLLEAMAAGNAVIATCVGGMTNIILDGYNGLFVRPGSADDIINAIDKLVNDSEYLNYLAKNAYSTAKASFSFDKWRERWGDVIKMVSSK